jgi:mRNA-degrading endonuclease RelE of RelBE toxin-antitoxin system
MVKVLWTQKFEQDFKHAKDLLTREKILKQIKKIAEKPDTGKPLWYSLKGERTINIKPYRLIYSFAGDILILLRFEYRKNVYN